MFYMGFCYWRYCYSGDLDMSIRDKLEKKKLKMHRQIQQMQRQIQRGRERTEQQKAERLRKKMDNLLHMKPGAKQAIVHGMMMRKSTKDVMRDEYHRRKYEREQKKKGK